MQLVSADVAMWRLGFFFHDVAFGLLTVFIPLYLVFHFSASSLKLLGGPLLALGVMTSIAIFCSIPASYLWGHLCDATRHYKVFILLAFASIATILFLMSLPFAQNLFVFVGLYVVMQVLHVAHESPKNVLVTEHYSRNKWVRTFGFYEGITELGTIAGLALGIILFASSLSSSALSTYTFYLCSALNVVGLILAMLLVTDPLLIFERRLVRIERKMDYANRGFKISSKLMDGLPSKEKLKEDSFAGFVSAIVIFSLATSLFFTPLPIFLREGLGLSTSWVYVAYILNSIGGTAGYFLIGKRAQSIDIRKQMPRYMFSRMLIVFALVGVILLGFFPNIMTGLFLLLLGFAYAMYYIMMLSLSMEVIPQGKTGLFDGMVNLGSAIGAFLGPFLAFHLNYVPMFVVTALLFLVAYLALKLLR